MSPEDRQLIKHAQKELIALCGGADTVTTIITVGRTTVYRWADTGDPTLMPGSAFLPLQRRCKMPVVTMAYASLENRLLTDPQECDGTSQCIYTAMADTMVACGALNSTYGSALADGKITLNELSEIDEKLAHLIQRATETRRQNAAQRAKGGISLLAGGKS